MFRRAISLAVPVMGLVTNESTSTYSLLMLGDWGGSGSSNPVTSMEKATISGMSKVAAAKGSSFALLLGDNFYSSGITSASRFEPGFEDAFSASAFSQMPFYAIAGNHDHNGNVKVQIEYSQQGTGRWHFPDYDYTIDKSLPDGKKLRFCMFDSVKNSGVSEMLDNGTLRAASGPEDLQAASVSWSKLETCLNSDADYLFTVAHYPAYSGCQHGSVMANTELPGLLSKYNAHGHIAGHDHCMQHIEKNGQYHIQVGAGSNGWYSYNSISGAKYHISSNNKGSVKGGFAELQFSSSGAKVVYYDDNGSALYTSSTLGPRSPPSPSPTPTPSPSPSGTWDCRTNYKASGLGSDTNLEYTGDDTASCQAACLANSGCQACYFHKTDSHCHILTGSFSHDSWSSKVSSNGDYDSCYLNPTQVV